MPILPPDAASVLDSVNSILTAAAARLNDEVTTLQPVSGNLLGAGVYFTQQMVNTSWREMCEFLANIGFTTLKQEGIITGLPIAASADPASTSWVDWTGCFDGEDLFDTPQLPPDLIVPLKVWERPSGQNAVFPIAPMELCFDGLPGLPKQIQNGCWEWRANKVYFPGSLQVMDFRVLYQRYLGDFLDVGDTQWFQQLVPIPRCQDALSLFVCSEFRPDGGFREKAESAARLLCNRDATMKQRGSVRRQSRSGRLEWRGW